MWLRLRQVALVASDLERARGLFEQVCGLAVCHRDPAVAEFGLHNILLPVGDQFIEVVAPTRDGTAAGRYLERRGGDGGYMVITQCDDHAPRRARVDALGVRVVHAFASADFRNLQLHPRDTGGSFFEIDQQLGAGADARDGPWFPAGPDWQRARRLDRVQGIAAAEIQADDPQAVAARWAAIAELPCAAVGPAWVIALDGAELRFVPIRDGRPEGLGLAGATPLIEHLRCDASLHGTLAHWLAGVYAVDDLA
ncbi:MAG: VOC family protein, partial [Gammaproteobacteria bacterium]|nr:VOC family protein [Gammaproteobacteria bacterium]